MYTFENIPLFFSLFSFRFCVSLSLCQVLQLARRVLPGLRSAPVYLSLPSLHKPLVIIF